ncbi:uncharacterized oxidoreductase SERP2049-like [Rhopilema esculentum]|uniref:uncharacterized oxidoreductase SERP2049-like n=1 Tax=Rhopilema esculentum TaxID=499914 RepID=UPI0031D51699|eukprot:gene3028-1301_t
MKAWAVITGAGTGIGSALTKELSSLDVNVLAIGRRYEQLECTRNSSSRPHNIKVLPVDIASDECCHQILDAIPKDDDIKYLVQNAAVGVPAKLLEIVEEDFEYAMKVNVTAPLSLTKGLFERLNNANGRIIHLGTGVAFRPQLGTTTYGVTKMAFYRLYKQLQVELQDTNVKIANIHPGVVDTEGLCEHIKHATTKGLPHVEYFKKVQQEGKILSSLDVAKFIRFVLLETSDNEFSKDWSVNDESFWPNWKKSG